MTPHMKYGIAGIVVGLILFIFAPVWLALGVVVLAVAIPAVLYAMLDPSQKRRLRRARGRKQLGG
jgi:hypothetical protein